MSEEEIDPGLELILPDERSDMRDRFLWGAVLVILTLWTFSPSIFGNYLWDDSRYPLNAAVQRGNDGLYDIWFNPSSPAQGDSPGHYTTPQYYPMTYTSYWLVYQIRGSDPRVGHAINMLLEAGSALLVWEILRRLKVPGAWVAAAIFAIHPLQTESVAWLSERKNVLAGVFFFGSILAYLRFLKIDKEDSKPQPADFEWYGLALLLFVAGLLSKSVVCSMPVVMGILLWWKRRLNGRNIILLLPFLVLGLAMSMVTSWFELHIVGATGPDWDYTWIQRLLIASHVVWFYAGKLILPIHLSLIYRKWAIDSAQWAYFAAAVLVLVVLVALVRKTGRGVLAAVLIYLVTLVPAMGFVNVYPMRYSFVADHFQYLSGVALIVLAVAIVSRLLASIGPGKRMAGFLLSVVVIGALALGAWSHAYAFTSPEALWRDVISNNPDAWIAYENLASALDDDAEQDLTDQDVQEGKQLAAQDANEAIANCKKALALRKYLDASYAHWGRALLILNQPAAALEKFRTSESLNPKVGAVHADIAVTLTRLGHVHEAEEEYRQALALPSNPNLRAVMRVSLGTLLLDDGAADMRKAIAAKDPAKAKALSHHVAAAYSEAHDQFEQATRDDPQYADAWFHLGVVLIRLNQNEQAFDALQQAVQLDPDLAAAHADLGMLYGIAKKYPEAGQEYLKVVTLQHDNADAYANMGILAEKLNRPTESKEFFMSALKFDPKNSKAKQGLAELAKLAATRPASTRPTAARAVSHPATAP